MDRVLAHPAGADPDVILLALWVLVTLRNRRPVESVLTTLLPLGPGGPPAKVLLPSVYRPAIALLLGKKDAAASPNLRAPQAPSVRARALTSVVADELCGRLADGRYRVQRRLSL